MQDPRKRSGSQPPNVVAVPRAPRLAAAVTRHRTDWNLHAGHPLRLHQHRRRHFGVAATIVQRSLRGSRTLIGTGSSEDYRAKCSSKNGGAVRVELPSTQKVPRRGRWTRKQCTQTKSRDLPARNWPPLPIYVRVPESIETIEGCQEQRMEGRARHDHVARQCLRPCVEALRAGRPTAADFDIIVDCLQRRTTEARPGGVLVRSWT